MIGQSLPGWVEQFGHCGRGVLTGSLVHHGVLSRNGSAASSLGASVVVEKEMLVRYERHNMAVTIVRVSRYRCFGPAHVARHVVALLEVLMPGLEAEGGVMFVQSYKNYRALS